jgi:hypothetical protein
MTVSKQFKQILEQSFTIFNCSWRRVSPNFVPRLAQFKNLQTLHFTTTKSTLHHIFSLKKLNYLTIEQLDRELLSPESFAGIGELKFLTRMWADAQFMDTTLPFLMEQLTSLRRLILYCPFSQALFDSLAKSTSHSNVFSLLCLFVLSFTSHFISFHFISFVFFFLKLKSPRMCLCVDCFVDTNLQYLCLIDSETNTEISRIFRIPLYSSLTCFELLNTMHIFDASDVIKITSLRSLALHYTDNILNYELLTRLTSLNELLVHTERDVMHKIQILTSLFNLTKLDFYTPRLDDSKLMYLTRISSLRSLALERMFADPLHIQTHIQHLTLLGLATPKTEDFSLFFLQHTQLIDLYLQSKPYWAINLQRVTLLRNLNRLTVGNDHLPSVSFCLCSFCSFSLFLLFSLFLFFSYSYSFSFSFFLSFCFSLF